MKHAGKARRAGLRLIALSLIIVILMVGAWSLLAARILMPVAVGLAGVWLVFLVFTLSFFRDPEARVPGDGGVYLSPAHGTVDVIEETNEETFIRGRCRRVSIFLSVFDVHVQNAPVSGRVAYLKHCPGRFVNAMKTDCGTYNENVLIGFDSAEVTGERVAARLIAGLIARRIIPWVSSGDQVTKGERISLIQFGSRVDLYLPLKAQVQVQLGQKVKGGETVVAKRG
jgi:phosphatidylserine decarboxylase